MAIPTTSKIIVALDFSNKAETLALVNQLDPRECRLKVGKALFTHLGPEFVKLLVNKGFDVFLDLKFHDIPNTVKGACEQAARLGIWMLNVHASGGIAMLKAAREAIDNTSPPLGKTKPLLIGVTLLTSLQESDLANIGLLGTIEDNVMRLASACQQAGLDGVVCSAKEVDALKKEFGRDFLCVTPGIRLNEEHLDDQKRVMTPKEALAKGVDYLVIGRAITQSEAPKVLLQQLNTELEVK